MRGHVLLEGLLDAGKEGVYGLLTLGAGVRRITKEIGTRPTLLPQLKRVKENHKAKESGSRALT